MARLNEYPDGTYRELREAAASYVGLSAEHVVVGAGADDLILLLAQVFLGPGRRAAVAAPTYALYRIATTLRGADLAAAGEDADLHWVCNPNNPTGSWIEPEEIAALAERAPQAIVVADEAYVEYGARSCAAVGRRASEPRRPANALEGVRLRLAPCRVRARASRHSGAAHRAACARPDRGAGGRDRLGRAAKPEARRRRGDDRRARARPRGARGRRVRRRADRDELRLPQDERAARGDAGAAGHGRTRVPGRHPDQHSPSERERRAPPCARRRARRPRRPRGDRAADDDRDRASADALARRDGPHARRDGHRVRRPPPDPARLPRGLRPRARGRRAISTSTSTTRSRTSTRRSGPPSPRRSGRARASPATDRRSCRWTRLGQPPRSTSFGDRTPRSR